MAIAKQLSNRYPILNYLRSFLVWAVLFYLRLLAKIAIHISPAVTIGIAGAVGKSTTRDALSSIVTPYAPTCVVEGNSETGIPLGILGLNPGKYSIRNWIYILLCAPTRIFRLRNKKYIIVEMGIDGPHPPKNMKYLLTIIQPQIGILLSESPAHIEQYEQILPSSLTAREQQLEYIVNFMIQDDATMLQTRALKSAIIDATDIAVYDYVKSKIKNSRLYTVGSTPEHDFMIHHHEISLDSTTFGFSLHSHQQKEYITLSFPGYVMPIEAGSSIGAAILACVHLGIPISDIQHNLTQTFSPPNGRCSIFQGKKGTVIIDSSYNASPASMNSFLNATKILKQDTKKPTIMVFGDMKELGTFSQIEHTRIARQSIGIIDHLILVGPLTKQYVLPFLDKHMSKFRSVVSFDSVTDASDHLHQHLTKDAIILVKGSQLLEELIKPLLLHPEDVKKLCRQDAFWEKSKQTRGVWLEV